MSARIPSFGGLRLGSDTKRGILIALTILLLFLSIALFSPLHRHVPGKGCSFNNLEHQWFALLELTAVVLVLMDMGLRETREEAETALTRNIRLHRGRAPPLAR